MAIAPGSRVLFNELSYGFFNQFIIPGTPSDSIFIILRKRHAFH
ncbi:hypothetical protein HM1_0603 [Heliomicrobium modesticaldum Ice1]|uniref:Uncharacterized protein n=1 Tax=Heliobacterium modesticaldum (strain ATCC 51547 / Ice1) TaxID=498761 RepID=B0TG51_HELMI|nr:hypothetical protein HM1_0603 [Heliomicrobium modesticaldum Ice1]